MPSVCRLSTLGHRLSTRWTNAEHFCAAIRAYANKSKVAGQFADRPDDLRCAVGFGQNATARRQVAVADVEPSRRRHNCDRRPPTSDGDGELQPIHGTRHLGVGKTDRDVASTFKDQDRFVGIFCFDNIETVGLDISTASIRTGTSSSTTRMTGRFSPDFTTRRASPVDAEHPN